MKSSFKRAHTPLDHPIYDPTRLQICQAKFVKVKCKKCGFLNLIPVYERLIFREPIECGKCGRMLVKRD